MNIVFVEGVISGRNKARGSNKDINIKARESIFFIIANEISLMKCMNSILLNY